MFLPRQLAIQKSGTPSNPQPTTVQQTSNPLRIDITDERPYKRAKTQASTEKEPKVSAGLPDQTYAAEVVRSLEMLFSDYSLSNVNGEWLRERMRNIEGYSDYIHLAALIENQIFAVLNPRPTQKTLLLSLDICPSTVLQTSSDKYHIRRDLPAKTSKSWEASTIYVEPNILGISSNPGRMARIILEGNMNRSVEWVEVGSNSWAFVTFSQEISEEDLAPEIGWPRDWIIMTKQEWKRRTDEYRHLRKCLYRQPRIMAKLPLQRSDFGPHLVHAKPDPNIHSYVPGLIVYLQNIHPESTKANITNFVMYNTQKYLRKKLSHRTSSNHTNDSKNGLDTAVSIKYVDYKPKCGFTNAHLRLKTAKDAEIVVAALKKRRRCMRAGEDKKGTKCKESETYWVNAELIQGERERAYWESIPGGKKMI